MAEETVDMGTISDCANGGKVIISSPECDPMVPRFLAPSPVSLYASRHRLPMIGP